MDLNDLFVDLNEMIYGFLCTKLKCRPLQIYISLPDSHRSEEKDCIVLLLVLFLYPQVKGAFWIYAQGSHPTAAR